MCILYVQLNRAFSYVAGKRSRWCLAKFIISLSSLRVWHTAEKEPSKHIYNVETDRNHSQVVCVCVCLCGRDSVGAERERDLFIRAEMKVHLSSQSDKLTPARCSRCSLCTDMESRHHESCMGAIGLLHYSQASYPHTAPWWQHFLLCIKHAH